MIGFGAIPAWPEQAACPVDLRAILLTGLNDLQEEGAKNFQPAFLGCVWQLHLASEGKSLQRGVGGWRNPKHPGGLEGAEGGVNSGAPCRNS